MKFLLFISGAIVIFYFGYVISKLDVYLAENAASIEADSKAASAIVLGRTIIAQNTVALLEEKGIPIVRLTDPFQLVTEQNLCYLFALSESDADNIAFYKLGESLYGIKSKVSICNDKRNENMFFSDRINYQLAEMTSAEILIQAMLHS